ncbi:MAG: MFS transporter [Propionibacteriaceae bacterium]|nr:MFS transporter [Propionibacteriaceae bacterium]
MLRVPGALAFCLAGLLARFGGAMVGIGTVLMASSLYGSYGLAGGLAAANAVAWALGTAYLSHLVDRHGQRKIMLPAALVSAGALAAMIILALAAAPLPYLFVCTILSGLAGGSPGAMVRARWSNVLTSSRDLHTAYSLESTLDEVTFVVGPVLATMLATSVHPVAGLVGPVILGAGGALVFYSLTATEPKVAPIEPGSHQRSRFILTYPGLAVVVAVGLLMGCMFGSIDVTTVAATSAWGARQLAGVILGVISLGSASGGLLYGSRGWVSPLWKRFVIGICFFGASVCLLFLATGPLLLGVFGFIAGFAVAPSFINANGLIGQIVPANRLTEGLAWLGTAIGIGVSIGSTLAGQVIDTYGYHAGYLCPVTAGVTACVVALSSIPLLRRVASGAAAARS